MITEKELIDKLEPLVDEASVESLLDALAQVCFKKSAHIANVWQDVDLSGRWERAGNLIQTLSAIKLGRVKAPGITN